MAHQSRANHRSRFFLATRQLRHCIAPIVTVINCCPTFTFYTWLTCHSSLSCRLRASLVRVSLSLSRVLRPPTYTDSRAAACQQLTASLQLSVHDWRASYDSDQRHQFQRFVARLATQSGHLKVHSVGWLCVIFCRSVSSTVDLYRHITAPVLRVETGQTAKIKRFHHEVAFFTLD